MRSVIYSTPLFSVTSYGNGAAYAFTNQAKVQSIHLQGDDAARFRADLEALEAARPEASASVILSRLWDDYAAGRFDYS